MLKVKVLQCMTAEIYATYYEHIALASTYLTILSKAELNAKLVFLCHDISMLN